MVIFSHGIGGIRSAYSGICTELSSAVGAPHLCMPAHLIRMASGPASQWPLFLRDQRVTEDDSSHQGFVVLAVEHADGTAATVALAGKAGHRFYGGWLSEDERIAQTRRCPGFTLAPFALQTSGGCAHVAGL